MKYHTLLITALHAAAALPLAAAPFTARPVPGFSVVPSASGASIFTFTPPALAADFMGNGRLQWYGGGSVITRFPDTGSLTLPTLTLPAWAGATVHPIGATVMDVDGDGDLDIFRLNDWNGYSDVYTMQVFLNNGSGVFSAGWRYDWQHDPGYNAGARFYKLAPGDFDLDGDIDLAMRGDWENRNDDGHYTGSLAIRWNDGAGQFPTTTSLTATGLAMSGIISAGDFDRDGDLDLMSNNEITYSNGLTYYKSRLFINNGSGAFTSTTMNNPLPATLVDGNGDGWLDLCDGGEFMPNMVPSGGTFGSLSDQLDSLIAPSALADVDGDGDLDMVGDLDDGISGILGVSYRGTNGWEPAVPLITLAHQPTSITAADTDADGDTDLMVALANNSTVLLENTAHHFQPDAAPLATGAVTLPGVTIIECADFNRDGRDDTLALAPSLSQLHLLAGESDGSPAAPVSLTLTGGTAGWMSIGDFDRDGRVDAAYTLPAAGEVRLVRNTGGPLSTWPISTIATGIPGVNLITTGEAGTANGRADMLVSSATTGQVRWIFLDSSGVWTGQNVRSSLSAVPHSLLAANASTRPGDEPFCLNASGGSLSVKRFELNPAWVEAAALSQPLTASPHSPLMAWADTNGDRDSELIFVNGSGGLSYWAPNAGNTSTLGIGSAPSAIRSLAATDWDRDGRTDMLCATATGLCLFRGGSSWERVDLHTASTAYQSARALDLNGDGFPDAAAVRSHAVEFFLNTPRVLRVASATTAPVSLTSGKSGTGFQAQVSHPGRAASFSSTWLNDVPVKITGVRMQFRRAIPDGSGGYTTGAGLTQAELTQLVHSVSLTIGGATIGSSGPGLIGANGSLSVTHNPLLGSLVPLHAGSTQTPAIRLNLTSTAHTAAQSRFFLVAEYLEADTADDSALIREVPFNLSGIPVSTLITITPDYSPIQLWRIQHFDFPDGTGTAANDADYDADGVPNLVEYALGTNPTATEPALNGTNALTLLPGITSGQALKFRLYTGTAAFADPKLRLTIQQSTSLGGWATLSQRTGGGTWIGLAPQFSIPTGSFTALTFQTAITPQNTKQYFLRLKAEELP